MAVGIRRPGGGAVRHLNELRGDIRMEECVRIRRGDIHGGVADVTCPGCHALPLHDYNAVTAAAITGAATTTAETDRYGYDLACRQYNGAPGKTATATLGATATQTTTAFYHRSRPATPSTADSSIASGVDDATTPSATRSSGTTIRVIKGIPITTAGATTSGKAIRRKSCL
jgi:hypothetical protein